MSPTLSLRKPINQSSAPVRAQPYTSLTMYRAQYYYLSVTYGIKDEASMTYILNFILDLHLKTHLDLNMLCFKLSQSNPIWVKQYNKPDSHIGPGFNLN